MIKSFEALAEAVQAMEKKRVFAIVEAQDAHTLSAVVSAQRNGIANALLFGRADEIRALIAEEGGDPDAFEIVPTASVEESLSAAVESIHAGRADAIMKGKLETAPFMKAVLRKDSGLIGADRVSLIGFYQHPNYHKLLAVTDQGMNTYPDLECKKDLVRNAVKLFHGMGIEHPKIACLCAVERVNPKMPETVDADALKQLNRSGELPGCIIEGPISFDLAVKKSAAEIKGFESEVAGDADLLLVPDITCGNVLSKCMTEYAGAMTAGTILGAKCPVIVTSRSAQVTDKYYSIALAAFAASC